ncbi:cupin domain-containing protein [Ningiella sp. W23]|uniref:cupin domain-containing protein n=1 Tax=Ningiella sp. W23 TaxID=3023715 RepID=UPI003756D0BC
MPGKYPKRIKQLEIFDGRFDAYKLKAQGADVLFASYPAGTSIEAHTHDTDNYGVLTRGKLLLTMEGKTSTFTAGQWYAVPAHAVHSAEFPEETDEIEFWFKPE